jgi:hypothetical protein
MTAPTPEIAPEVVERAIALVRDMSAVKGILTEDGINEDYAEARALVALLPEPVDADLIEARKICQSIIDLDLAGQSTRAYVLGELDGSLSMRCAMAAIKAARS